LAAAQIAYLHHASAPNSFAPGKHQESSFENPVQICNSQRDLGVSAFVYFICVAGIASTIGLVIWAKGFD
jgi:hypothetical protein